MTYGAFRNSDQVPDFATAHAEVFAESKEFAEQGIYGKPASRRAVLGRMFQYKQAAWKSHQQKCRYYAEIQEQHDQLLREVPF